MMKYLIFIFAILMSVSALAQDDYLVKTDGTKYYLQVYDGETNEKVVDFNFAHASGYEKIQVADYFDGSGSQLWSFTATEMYPGYFSINNHSEDITPEWSMMSWNWHAYLTNADNRDPATDMEMQFRFVEAFDGYFILETIEKPTDGSLYNIEYTPGADAFNVKDGVLSFRGVKSADITRENMANKVFKVVEFNPMTLFEESIVRGDDLYNANPNAPSKVRYDLFYVLEKAREIRVFGADAEMLAFQENIDAAMVNFNTAISFVSVIDDAKAFIDAAEVDQSVKNSFNAVIDEAEAFIYSDDLNYSELDGVNAKLEGVQDLVEAIIAAQVYGETLTGSDTSLNTGLDVSIANAKAVLADSNSGVSEFSAAVTHMTSTQTVIDEIIVANDLIAATQEFEETKAAFEAAIQQAITTINTEGTSSSALDQAVVDMQDAIKAFQKALEAGDTPIELKNAYFDDGSSDWNWDTDTPSAVRPSAKGVDGSKSMTLWAGAAYHMKFFQSISNIPDGVYVLSAIIQTNIDGAYKLFAESGTNVSETSITLGEGGLEKRQLEITIVDGKLEFGVRGAGENNGLSAGSWVVLDDFELKWSSNLPVANPIFEEGSDGWLWDTDALSAVRPSAKGVDGSKSMTLWNGSAYHMKFYQTVSGIPDGVYIVSAFIQTNIDSVYNLYAESGTNVSETPVVLEGGLAKRQIEINVVGGNLEFGVRGAGENNGIVAGGWVVIDNVELKWSSQLNLINPKFDEEKVGYNWDTDAPSAVRPSAKGVDGSKSMTLWNGSAYYMKFYQTATDLMNGTYEVSAFISTNIDGAYNLYAESGANISETPVTLEGGLAKRKTEIAVETGTVDFGVVGAGENNALEAGSWVVMDNFELRLKSIAPVYELVEPTPEKMLVTDIETQKLENEIIYWQSNQRLNIQSNDVIMKYSVYSITGTMVENKESRSNTLSIPIRDGIYIVRVLTESGSIDTEKVVIR